MNIIKGPLEFGFSLGEPLKYLLVCVCTLLSDTYSEVVMVDWGVATVTGQLGLVFNG